MESEESRGLARKIAGEISTSPRPWEAIRKWRNIFDLSQADLAQAMDVSPSVISDYESGRRKSPRIDTIKRIIKALFETDLSRGGSTMKSLTRMVVPEMPEGVVLAIQEFSAPIQGNRLLEKVEGSVVVGEDFIDRDLFGFTVIDSVKAILELRSSDFMKFYGLTSERALIFTRVSTGRSPFVAIKVGGINPGLVVLHGANLSGIDQLGKRIAEKENIPVAISKCPTVEDLIDGLRSLS